MKVSLSTFFVWFKLFCDNLVLSFLFSFIAPIFVHNQHKYWTWYRSVPLDKRRATGSTNIMDTSASASWWWDRARHSRWWIKGTAREIDEYHSIASEILQKSFGKLLKTFHWPAIQLIICYTIASSPLRWSSHRPLKNTWPVKSHMCSARIRIFSITPDVWSQIRYWWCGSMQRTPLDRYCLCDRMTRMRNYGMDHGPEYTMRSRISVLMKPMRTKSFEGFSKGAHQNMRHTRRTQINSSNRFQIHPEGKELQNLVRQKIVWISRAHRLHHRQRCASRTH